MEQKPFTLRQKAHIACFLILWIALLFFAIVMFATMPAHAAVINPSINDRDPWWCENKITGWICPDRGAQGYQGINGTKGDPGEPNFTAIYYNATNFTVIANFTHFYNATNFNITSNYTVVNGASFYNTTAINESYAYLPGRAGGQVLNGGMATGDTLVLNGSANGGNVFINPRNGFVTIGNSTASKKFQVQGTDGGTISLKKGDNIDGNLYYEFKTLSNAQSAYLGYGSTNWNMYLANLQDGNLQLYNDGAFRITIQKDTGNVGIGTTSPTAQLHTTGTVRFANYGAGTATFDAGGNLTSVSDSKAKTNIAPYSAGLAQVLALSPKQYHYSPDSGLDTQNTYVGFIAQDVEKVLPNAVKTKEDTIYVIVDSKDNLDLKDFKEVKTGTTTKSLDDRAIIAALVNAVKEQQTEIDALKARIEKLETSK